MHFIARIARVYSCFLPLLPSFVLPLFCVSPFILSPFLSLSLLLFSFYFPLHPSRPFSFLVFPVLSHSSTFPSSLNSDSRQREPSNARKNEWQSMQKSEMEQYASENKTPTLHIKAGVEFGGLIYCADVFPSGCGTFCNNVQALFDSLPKCRPLFIMCVTNIFCRNSFQVFIQISFDFRAPQCFFRNICDFPCKCVCAFLVTQHSSDIISCYFLPLFRSDIIHWQATLPWKIFDATIAISHCIFSTPLHPILFAKGIVLLISWLSLVDSHKKTLCDV